VTEGTAAARAALARELERHVAADPAEEADRRWILALLAEERAFDRSFYAPGHITGSAFVVHPDGPRVLLHHHRRLDLWLQLGGHDDGEHDVRATALREAREESGLADVRLLSPAILDVDVHRIPAGRGEPPHRHFDVRFACTTSSPEAVRRLPGESLDLRWFSLGEAAAVAPDDGTRRALLRLAAAIPAGPAAPRGGLAPGAGGGHHADGPTAGRPPAR
jgi:8-oxo-dGTP pyrophosphatase MutT (NUDIX family)